MATLHALAIDVETTGTDPETDAVVELAAVGIRIDPATGQYDALRTLFTSLVDPGRDIPAAAAAVHHLTARDVHGQPRLAQALAGLQDAVQAFRPHLLVAHNAAFDSSFLPGLADALTPDDPRWACTLRLAQHLWPTAPGHGLQVLRYWRHLQDHTPGHDAHRAAFDAGCCAVLLAEQCRVRAAAGQPATPALLRDRTAETPLLGCVTFGKHRGKPWCGVPRDYLEWILQRHASGAGNPFDSAVIATVEAALRGVFAIPPGEADPGEDD